MNTSADRQKALEKLLTLRPKRRKSEAAEVVQQFRSLLVRALRRGHSLEVIAAEMKLKKGTLQRHLNKAGIFVRKPRKQNGLIVRPYRRNKTR